MMEMTDIKIVNQMTSMILEGAKSKIPPPSDEPPKSLIEDLEKKLVKKIFNVIDKYVKDTKIEVNRLTVETIRIIYSEINSDKSIGWNQTTYPENNGCATGQKCLCLKWGGGNGTMCMEMETFVLEPYPILCKSCHYMGKEIKYIDFQKYLTMYMIDRGIEISP
jgi:hypothetical protein